MCNPPKLGDPREVAILGGGRGIGNIAVGSHGQWWLAKYRVSWRGHGAFVELRAEAGLGMWLAEEGPPNANEAAGARGAPLVVPIHPPSPGGVAGEGSHTRC